MKRIISLISSYKWRLLIIVFVNIFSVVFSIFTLLMLEPFLQLVFYHKISASTETTAFINRLLERFFLIDGSLKTLFWLILFAVILFLLKNITAYLSQWLMAHVRSGVIKDMREKLYHRVLILPLSFYSKQRKGDIVSRAVNDTQEIEIAIMRPIQQLLKEPLTVILYLVALFIISYKLSLFVLVLLPIAGMIIAGISKKLRRKSLEAKQKMGLMSANTEEAISGLKIIKAFNAIDWMNDKFKTQNEDYTRLQIKINRRYDLASPVSEFLGTLVVMIILLYGGHTVLEATGTLTAERFITYIALFIQIINPAKNISVAVYDIKKGLSSLDRIQEIIDADEVIVEKPNAIPLNTFTTSIEFKDVNFGYKDRPVLNHLTYTIRKGQTIAICGQSGSGKSTLVDLLQRFHDVQNGEILFDGISLDNYKIEDLRAQFAVVSQDVILFNDTVAHNIAFGMKEVPYERIVNAAKIANAYSFIMEMSQGFDTIIGDRGVLLSGGQRQRISVARAILKNAPILVFDEATSAMDTESEKLLQESLAKVSHGKTLITIAHRLSTVHDADEIVMLEHGYIIEKGSHEDLIQRDGYYAKYVQMVKSNNV